MSGSSSRIWTCSRCIRAQHRSPSTLVVSHHAFNVAGGGGSRAFGASPIAPEEKPRPRTTSEHLDRAAKNIHGEQTEEVERAQQQEQEQGAMSRRLSEMAEETIDTGNKSDHKLMRDVGFSDDLKRQLEERIAQTGFAAQHQGAASQVNLPHAAGQGTRDMAAAEPWTGSESLHDAALRMLDDSHKRLRPSSRSRTLPHKPSLQPAPKKNVSRADRLANARDKTSMYAFSQQNDMSEQEREKWRKELKDRFSPGARPMPATLQGLSSLANERIEDAIARGQFKNIPRGKGTNVERDYNANSPFLDTTEYFMNKIIQKQEIVPPWIEKQQELVKAVTTFRSRLRHDWRRHAARLIASAGGTVQDQVRRARGYALTEEQLNPRLRKVESLSSIASDGSLTSITVEERIAAGVPVEQDQGAQAPASPDLEIKVTEQPATAPGPNENTPQPVAEASNPTYTSDASGLPSATNPDPEKPQPSAVLPMPHPFRDSAWEKTELAYHTLAVQELNRLTRSYNLMAPKVAQKPYYTLARELNRCFADVAPTLADEILDRSRKPRVKIELMPHKEGGVLERFGAGQKWNGYEGRIRDEVEGKEYGFKQFWKDLFADKGRDKKREKEFA